jgi:hypothetical protein
MVELEYIPDCAFLYSCLFEKYSTAGN